MNSVSYEMLPCELTCEKYFTALWHEQKEDYYIYGMGLRSVFNGTNVI